MLYSFDVFDMVITRKTATPQGIWKLMQNELLHEKAYDIIPEYVRKNFYDLRIRVERLMRVNNCYNGVEDVSLSQIYDGFVRTGYVNREQSRQLEELENQTELSCVLGISENICAVKKLLQAGQRVIFISDMYLSEKTIRRMLAVADPALAELPLYISGEYKKSKWTGALYSLIKQKEKTEYTEWMHTGDNKYSDVEVPLRLGIKATLFCSPGLCRAGQYVLREEKKSVYAEFAAGISRYVMRKTNKKGAWTVGVTTGANILLPYVLWILKEVREQGIRRLYFIARDGYILKLMADKIISCNDYAIETAYIYGSRKAWRLPGISDTNNDLVELISWSHPPQIETVDRLADAFGITEFELLQFLPDGFDRKIKFFSYSLYIVVNLLNQNIAFKKYLVKKHKKKRMLVKNYLAENIDIHDDRFAFVELAGSGYTQKCLADLLAEVRLDRYFFEKEQNPSIKTFYFKMDRVNHWKECEQLVFFPDQNVKNLIIEMICRAYHGQTIGYEEKDGHVQPVLDDEGRQLLDYKYDEYIDGILQYTDYACKKNPRMLVCGQTEGLAVSAAYLSYLLKSGDSEEFLYYADMPNNLTGRSDRTEPFAPALTEEQLEQIFYSRRFEKREDIYQGTCFELSIERCSEEQKRKIQYYQKKAAEENQRQTREKTFAESFPVGILGNRIILYGAGRYGNQLYDILDLYKDRQIVQWIDRNYENIENEKKKVEGLEALGKEEYDCVLIGVVSEESADEIRTELMRRGIPAWKIYWLGKSEVNRYLMWNQDFRWI